MTLTLTDDVDVSRGDLLADASAPAQVSDRIAARIFWMGQGTLAPGGRYHIKLGTASAAAHITGPMHLIDLAEDAAIKPVDRLMSNEFGLCHLELDRPLAADRYDQNRETGSFILIDAETHDTVAMGLVENAVAPVADTSTSEAPVRTSILGKIAVRVARLLGANEIAQPLDRQGDELARHRQHRHLCDRLVRYRQHDDRRLDCRHRDRHQDRVLLFPRTRLGAGAVGAALAFLRAPRSQSPRPPPASTFNFVVSMDARVVGLIEGEAERLLSRSHACNLGHHLASSIIPARCAIFRRAASADFNAR